MRVALDHRDARAPLHLGALGAQLAARKLAQCDVDQALAVREQPPKARESAAPALLHEPYDARAIGVDGREQRAQPRRGRRRRRRPRRGCRDRSRRDSALSQPEKRAADFAAERAARPRFHRGEHRRRLRARDCAERARDRERTDAGRGAQLAQARDRLGGRRGRVETGRAEICVLALRVAVSHRE